MGASGRRILLSIGVALTLAAGLTYAFWPSPVPVDLATVERGPLMVTIDHEGESRVRDVYVVSAPIGGRVLRIEGEVGDAVVAGETVVASLQPTQPAFLDQRARSEAEARVAAAKAALGLADAELARARAEADFAKADLDRTRALVRRETIAQRALDLAELEMRSREAAVATAEAAIRVRQSELATARAALIEPASDRRLHPDGGARTGADLEGGDGCCLELKAPVSGRILRVLHPSERVVTAGTALVEIGDPAGLEVVADLLSQDAVKVAPGARVMIEDWGGGEVLAGEVRRVEPYGYTKVSALGIEEQRVNVVIDLTDPAAARRALGHGYRVTVRIVVWAAEDVLQVPLGALFRAAGDWAVFAEIDGRATRRMVRVGERNQLAARVLAGLEAGERVVLHPSDRVTDDVRIVERTLSTLD